METDKKRDDLIKGGEIAGRVLDEVLKTLRPGINTWQLEELAGKLIGDAGAKPSFVGFKGYRFATCVNINETIVHGLPSKKTAVRRGDLVTVDLGVHYRGLHTDTAATVEVETSRHSAFLAAGRRALESSIKECRPGSSVGDISFAIQKTIEAAGFFVSRELTGHGVGKNLHEEPTVPCFGRRGEGALLRTGMALAIEVIYAQKKVKLHSLSDGWTLTAPKGCLTAVFEKTVLVADSGPIVLTNWE